MLPEALEDISKAESKAKYIHIYILGSFVEKSLFNLHFFVFQITSKIWICPATWSGSGIYK